MSAWDGLDEVAVKVAVKVKTGILVVVALLSAGARGAEFIAVEDECNGRHLLVQGPIEPGDDGRFRQALADHVSGELPAVQDPDVLWTVALDSPGGDLDAAMAMGRLLREALATTEVSYRYARRPDGVWDFARGGELVCLDGEDRLSGCHRDLVEAECTGACLLIWLGGATRHANEGRLGAHGLRAGAGPTALALQRYLREMALPEAWIARLTGAPEPGAGWLDWPQRHQLGGRAPALQALIADCPAALSRDESYQSVTAESALVRDGLMDRADAHRACRRTRLAAARADLRDRLARSAGSAVETLAARGVGHE